jgi:hypothetical protein
MKTSRLTAGGCAAVLCLGSGCTLQDFDELGSALTNGGGAGAGSGVGGAENGGSENGGSGPDASPGETGGSGGSQAGAGGSGEEPQVGNLMTDPSFEAGHPNWAGFGMSTILDVSTGAHTGSKCIASGNRTQSWEGPSYDAILIAKPGKSYQIDAWVRLDVGATSQTVNLSIKSVCVGETELYTPMYSIVATPEWANMTGVFTVPDCTLQELRPYFEGPAPATLIYIDDASLTAVL